MVYCKQALRAVDLVALLRSRGLRFINFDRAERYINCIGYHRLSAYFPPFYGSRNVFRPKVKFNDILCLYVFDRKLRLITLDPVQRIEVSIRTTISNYMSLKYNPFWYMDYKLFSDVAAYHKFIGILIKHTGKSSLDSMHSCRNFCSDAGMYQLPPSWMIAEELPLGCWSKLYEQLNNKQDKRNIADRFNFKWEDFLSWLKFITTLRNLLSHHRRFWNTTLPIQPVNLKRYAPDRGTGHGSYINFVVVWKLLRYISPNSHWNLRLNQHLQTSPFDIHYHMGFPTDWQELKFWK